MQELSWLSHLLKIKIMDFRVEHLFFYSYQVHALIIFKNNLGYEYI